MELIVQQGEPVLPPTTFTLVLQQDEAEALSAVISADGIQQMSELRTNNPAIYEIVDPLYEAVMQNTGHGEG